MFAVEPCAAVRRYIFVEGKSGCEAARVFGLSRDTSPKCAAIRRRLKLEHFHDAWRYPECAM